jgi:hypothetical protein
MLRLFLQDPIAPRIEAVDLRGDRFAGHELPMEKDPP